MSDLNITGSVTFDASQAEGALDGVGRKAGKFSVDMQQAGDRAGKALAQIGEIANANGEKFTKTEASIANSIKRIVSDAAKAQPVLDRLGDIEFNIAAKGLDRSKFAASLDIVKSVSKEAQDSVNALAAASANASTAATGSLNKIGISAGQTKAALSQLPAQFTDIVTSLQGGQAPLTVLIQQGGQIKDSFGGAGNAARAMGGYIMGMINPLTVAAAGAVALAVAFYQGSKEAENYNKALILSGNIAGTTTAQMTDMARALGEGRYTQGAAADAIAALAQSGAVAGEKLQAFASVAIDVEKATGQSIGKTAEIFRDLGKAPLEATAKLNETLNYLTLSIYEQIKALTEQGRVTDAARLAQDSYADVISQRAKQITENNGFLETSWAGVMRAAKGAWDAMVGVGRSSTGSDQLARLRSDLAARQSRGPLNDTPGMAAAYEKGNKALTDQIAMLDRLNGAQAESAKVQAEQSKTVAAKIAWDKESEKFLSKKQQLEREILKTQVEGQALLEKGAITQKQYAARLANVRDTFKETGTSSASAGQSELASIRAKVVETQRYIDAMKSQGLEAAKQTEGEKLAAKYREELTGGLKGAARANKELALAQAEKLDGLQKEQSALEGLLKAQKDFEASREKEIVARNNEILKIEEKAQALEDEIAAYGMGKAAIEAMTIARLEEKKAILGGFDGSQERIAQIDAEIAARKRYAADSDKLAGLKAGTQAEEVLRNAKEQAKLYEDEYKLTGLTALERAKVVAQRKVELDYAKKLAELDKLPDGPEKESARIKINEAKLIESSAAVNKVIQDDFAKTADQINQSLTDALMRGFESGKGFGQSLRDSLINMFKTMVLRPIISAVMAPVSGVVNGAIGMGLDAVGLGGGGAGGLLNTASTANSLYGAATGYSSGVNAAAGFLGAGSTVGASAVSLGYANAVGAVGGDALGALIAGNASWGGVAAGGAATAGAGAAGAGAATAGLAAVPVAGWIALAAIAAYAAFSGKEDSRFGSQGSYTPGKGTESNGGPNGANDDFGGVSAGNKTTAENINSLLEKLGSKDRLSYFAGGFESSENDKGFSYAGGVLDNGKVFGQGTDGQGYMNLRGSMNAKEAQARYINELKQATLEALQSATDIPKAISDKLDGVDIEALDTKALDALVATIYTVIMQATALQDAFNLLPFNNVKELSFDAAAGLAAAAGGFEQLQANLGVFYENFYGSGEKAAAALGGLTAQFDALGVTLPTSQGALRDLIASQDLSTQAGQQMAASLFNLVPAFFSVSEAARQSAAQMSSILSSYGSAAEQRQFQLEQIRQGLADGGVYVTTDQLGSISKDQAWQYYKDAVNSGDQRSADAIRNQLEAFAQVNANNRPMMDGGSGGGGGGGGGGANPWKSAADAIVSAIKDLKNSLLQTGPDGFMRLQAQYAIDVAKAKAGDLEAAQGLPALAKAVASAGKDYGQTALEQAMLIGNLIESLDGVIKARGFGASPLLRPGLSLPGMQIPAFAAGGMHTGGWAMVGERGPELVNLGPSRVYNANDTQNMMRGGKDPELLAAVQENNQLLRDVLIASQGTRQNTGKTATTLDQAANGAQPLGMVAMT